MKLISIYILLIGSLALMSCSPKSASSVSGSKSTESGHKNTYLGDWSYVVPGTPMGDVTGKMILKLENGLLKGYVESDGTISMIEDIKLVEKQLSGNIYYSGTLVKMEGTFEGDKYSGNLIADGAGIFKIQASRIAN